MPISPTMPASPTMPIQEAADPGPGGGLALGDPVEYAKRTAE